jgi:phosphopantothenoylcysteine decarboxylase/phosphopantothenate--cysteine ligase
LAHDFAKPFLLAPAMNTKMYLHPVTQQSITKLKNMGVSILETASGVLACGEVGWGRLLEPELIFLEVEAALAEKTFFEPDADTVTASAPERDDKTRADKAAKTTEPPSPKILITAGGTSEDIDDVRVITNKSTGKTTASIADALLEAGFQVTYLHSANAAVPKLACEKETFYSFNDLKTALEANLKESEFSAVIHAAAVSDYSVTKQDGKISSDKDEIQLNLKKNPKLINEIKRQSPKSNLIGFKLTSGADEKTIQKKVDTLFEAANCDYVIQNDWKQKESGTHRFQIYSNKNRSEVRSAKDLNELAALLFQILTAKTFELENNMESL